MQEEILIHSFSKNENQIVKLFLKTYEQRRFFDLRIWFKEEGEEEFKPSRRGIMLPLENLGQVRKGLFELGKRLETEPEQAPRAFSKPAPQASKQTFTARREAGKMAPKSAPVRAQQSDGIHL